MNSIPIHGSNARDMHPIAVIQLDIVYIPQLSRLLLICNLMARLDYFRVYVYSLLIEMNFSIEKYYELNFPFRLNSILTYID